MEFLWYVIASLGAGVGTGLAGLSAATVMVPILIVLCPSFATEQGPYQATAIALASDVLGSAVTAATYARHGNIDLRRGWLLMVCVLSMCVLGSYVAYRVGNVVLGTFTLFLTLGIGIRFLVSPDSSRGRTGADGTTLHARGIAISVFFGLTIGFGTGFVGTGGGMMMLVVFTAFLGMELKTAVGTSTLIMTFTALIASVSHMLIHPAIITERWDVLVVSIAVSTFSSLVSARFANRVDAVVVGRVCGAALTVLGAGMLILRYRDALADLELVGSVLHCMGAFVTYVIPCVGVLLPVRLFTKVPSYVFRKLLHIVAFTCTSMMIVVADGWLAASLTFAVLAALIHPVLGLFEGKPWYARLFVQKTQGEIRRSLLMLFIMFAVLVAVGWGIFDQPYLVSTAILVWGTGDAAAALVGIPFGRHKVWFWRVQGTKSLEGSSAMLVVSFVCGFLMLVLAQGLSVDRALFVALVVAFVATLVELNSGSEVDTVSVPVATLAVLLLLC